MEELTGKVAVVTGGASGIGLALGRAFAAEGMAVVLADIEAPALEAAAASFPDSSDVLSVVCDVAVAEQVEALRQAALHRFGAVHVLCNNAGVSTGGPIWTQSLEDWDWTLGVNLHGVIHGVRAFVPGMIEQGEGHVVNTASMAGLISAPFMGVYNVSKHAVVALTETLHADLATAGIEGVGASVLCPGWVNTRIHEAARNRPGATEAEPTEEQRSIVAHVGQLLADGLDPEEVADLVVDAVLTRRFYVLTHPEWSPLVADRVARMLDGRGPAVDHLPT